MRLGPSQRSTSVTAHFLAGCVVGDLVAVDLAEREVARFGMREVEAADAGAGPHGEGLGDLHAGVGFDVEQLPDGALLGVVGAGGIAGGGADAAILFLDEFGGGEGFRAAVAPLVAHALVEALGEGFGEAVGDGLGHDGVVVVVGGAEAVAEFLEADAAGDGEGADVVGQAGFFGSDEVGERAAGFAAFAVGLLAEEVEALAMFGAGFVGVEFDVVADGVGREEAVDAARGDEILPR